MLSGVDFIVFSDDWGRHPFSCKHIMRHFLPANRVLWVQTVGLRSPKLSWYDLRRSFQKLGSFLLPQARQNDESLPENLVVLNPVMLPFGNRLVRALNRWSVQRKVHAKMSELGYRNPVLLTTLPNAADYLGGFGERAAIYYCVDDFTLWPGVNQAVVADMEQALLDKVDLLACTSGELAALKKRPGLPVSILAHGVDFDHFASAGQQVEGGESLLGPGRKPVIGYFGLLGDWVDLDLLGAIAKNFPEATVLLIGTVVADIARLSGYANIRCPGPVPYEELPRSIAGMDVLILPYLTGGRGQTITPLKLREYLATGKPVVAADIPECRLFDSVMSVAGSREEFLAGIERGLAEGMAGAELRRASVVRETWHDRAEQLSELVAGCLAKETAS
jgi:glycosyltransferase involved in cell wall biosynthesis